MLYRSIGPIRMASNWPFQMFSMFSDFSVGFKEEQIFKGVCVKDIPHNAGLGSLDELLIKSINLNQGKKGSMISGV